MATEKKGEYSPTYRQQDVDEQLEEHDTRLSRLEKAVLIMLGYAIAEGANIVQTFSDVLI